MSYARLECVGALFLIVGVREQTEKHCGANKGALTYCGDFPFHDSITGRGVRR
jgi:hypothetical protein